MNLIKLIAVVLIHALPLGLLVFLIWAFCAQDREMARSSEWLRCNAAGFNDCGPSPTKPPTQDDLARYCHGQSVTQRGFDLCMEQEQEFYR